MPHWLFVIAAYAISLLSVAMLLGLSWRAMIRAERAADAEGGDR